MNNFAPILLFVFNRPEHTRRVLESLKQNPEFAESKVFIYCDGPRRKKDETAVNAVRELVKSEATDNMALIFRDVNLGLANSIRSGVTEICNRFGRAIIVEDDLIVAGNFLSYMNRSLEVYAQERRVMQISGYMFPCSVKEGAPCSMLPIISTWGWATWKRAWDRLAPLPSCLDDFFQSNERRRRFDLGGAYPYSKRLLVQMQGGSDSWGIQWYATVFALNGLVIYPPSSLVLNEGMDGSGIHSGVGLRSAPALQTVVRLEFPLKVEESSAVLLEVCKSLRREYSILARLRRKIATLQHRLKGHLLR